MTLSDYSTSAEKIAALKSAMLDPSLVKIATAGFTADDIIYVICSDTFILNGFNMWSDSPDGFNSRIDNGDIVSGFGSIAMVYVKDSDIVYSAPVDTYQRRLSAILTTNLNGIGNGSSFTAGAYGALIPYGYGMKLSTGESLDDYGAVSGKMLPIPPGQIISTHSYTDCVIRYFDVPSDW